AARPLPVYAPGQDDKAGMAAERETARRSLRAGGDAEMKTSGNFHLRQGGYLLTEALVYIGLLFVILGVGYLAMDRSIDNSVLLRRNADDIANALHAGERWRADV